MTTLLEKNLRSIEVVTVIIDESVLRSIASLISVEKETQERPDGSPLGGIKVALPCNGESVE